MATVLDLPAEPVTNSFDEIPARTRVKPMHALPPLIAEIREMQRQRRTLQKSRIMISNRLTANVATHAGYHASMEDDERLKRFAEAKKVITAVQGDTDRETETPGALTALIQAATHGIDGFFTMEKGIEKEMEKAAKKLPIAKWQAHYNQRGFGLLSLAIIIGEAGDLSNYDNPGKLWKRMGCAPIESKGKLLMPSTWRSRKKHNGGLTSAEWEEAGYCPRRRSVMYVIGESLLKGNGPREATEKHKALPAGPYATRYATKKAEAIARNDPDWTPACQTCKGSGKGKSGAECKKCSGRGYMVMRPHLHGMLLASKRLLRELWTEWRWVVDGIEPEPWTN